MEDKKYTAYCGLYCKDCIPSNQRLFQLIYELDHLLKELKFKKYAELKSVSNHLYKNYPQFEEMLGELGKLECKALCTQGGCKKDCEIRECVEKKKYDGCWECSDYKNCNLLGKLKQFHFIEDNLDLIREYGPEKWTSYRKKHYKWL
jgi:hypothetical protein